MAREELERFNQIVMTNPELQERLRNSPDVKAFTSMVVSLGQQQGCTFTADDVMGRLAANAQARSGDRELSDKDLELAAGGRTAYSYGSDYRCAFCDKSGTSNY